MTKITNDINITNNFILAEDNDHPSRGRIHLGLMCINNTLREEEIFCSRTCNRKNFSVEKAKELSLKNVQDISKLIIWNVKNGIHSLRISSDLFPHFTDTETEKYSLEFVKEELEKVGKLAKRLNHRLTFHPGQFCQVGANDPKIFENTISELKMHCDVLDMMGIDDNGIVNIHLGGVYGDKEKTKKRWIEQFNNLPSEIQKRLTIENDEKCYSTRDCLDVAQKVGIPVVFDNHHYECYTLLHPKEKQEGINELLPEVVETWGERQVLCHISEQDTSKKTGAHSDYISKLPDYYLNFPSRFDRDLWIDIEAKAKEAAVLKIYEKYPKIFKN